LPEIPSPSCRGELPADLVQLPRQGDFPEIDRRPPQDSARGVDNDANTAIPVEEGQSIATLVGTCPAFANRCNRPVSQQRWNLCRLEVQLRSKQCGIDKYVASAQLDLATAWQFTAPELFRYAWRSDQPGNQEHPDHDQHKAADKHGQQGAFILGILIAVLIGATHVNISPISVFSAGL
jgi:hypothetical protein